MLYKYTLKYDFDNFESPYKFKIKIKNGSKFKFLNNYYEYYFYPRENEQNLYCHCVLKENNKEEAEKQIKFSNNIFQYISCVPILDGTTSVSNETECEPDILDMGNISTKKIEKLKYISDKVLKFKVERGIFEEVVKLNGIALSNIIKDNIEDAILYYFKIIEKLSKKNYVKFHEKNYTKKIKRINKNELRNFIEKYFNENFKVSMTENMLNTSTDEIYKTLRNEAYNSIFLKISFFCNYKNIDIDLEKLNMLVKVRNKLAHGDFVEEELLHNSLQTACWLSNECISLYFFKKKYNEIHFDTDIYDESCLVEI